MIAGLLLVAALGQPAEAPVLSEDRYRLGVEALEADRLSDAAMELSAVSPRHPSYMRAQYLLGIANNRLGKLKSAVRAFRDAYRTPSTASTPDGRRHEAMVRDLALLNIARIYYTIEQFGQAQKYYAMMPSDSTQWAQATFESAWADFMLNQAEAGQKKLEALSGRAGRDVYNPELPYLQAVYRYNALDFESILPIVDSYEQTWRPIYAELAGVVERHGQPDGRADLAELSRRYGEGRVKDTALPAPLLRWLRLDTELIVLTAQIEHAQGETRVALERRAGEILLRRMRWRAEQLDALLDHMRVMRFEAVDALHQHQPSPESADLLRALIADPPRGTGVPELSLRLAATLPEGDPQAIAALEAAAQRGPEDPYTPEIWYRLGLTYADRGDRARAAEALSRGVEAGPDAWFAGEALVLLGDLRFDANQMLEARALYARVTGAQAGYALYKAAWCDLALGQRDQGLSTLRMLEQDAAVDEAIKVAIRTDLGRLARAP